MPRRESSDDITCNDAASCQNEVGFRSLGAKVNSMYPVVLVVHYNQLESHTFQWVSQNVMGLCIFVWSSMPVGLMRAVRATSVDLDRDRVQGRVGGESDLRTLASGPTVNRADQIATGGWHPPPGIINRHDKMDDSHCASQNSHHHQSRTIRNRAQDEDNPSNTE